MMKIFENIEKIRKILLKLLLKIPPFKFFYKNLQDFVEYHIRETHVFCNHMPKWFTIYENSLKFRIIRFILGFWIVFSRIFLENIIDISVKFSIFINIVNFAILVFFSCVFLLKFFLRFIHVKELVYNSPFSIKNCVFLGIKQICFPLATTTALGLGMNIVDVTAENAGYVPPFRHYNDSMAYYITRGHITKKIGTENFADYELFSENSFRGANFLREHQQTSLHQRQELCNQYQARQEALRIREDSVRVREENRYNS